MNVADVAAVVVLHHPMDDVIQNIRSYSGQVKWIFIVDNSQIENSRLELELRNISNADYITNHGNKGIAYALNEGARMALESGFSWLLTMDQDTSLPSNYVQRLLGVAHQLGGKKIGILAPVYVSEKPAGSQMNELLYTMTSGNLLNLKAFREVGNFREELFIDHVDHEYGLRLNQNGYKVIEAAEIILDHIPGFRKTFPLSGRLFRYSSHSPQRLYYFCRNGFLVSRLYKASFPAFRIFFLKLLLREVITTVFFENQKLPRLKALWEGYLDYKRNRFGARETG